MSLTVTVVDDQTGATETISVPEGDYLLVCHEPCHLAHTQAHGNGTHIVTIKGRTRP
jgi:hypothetical protein